MHVWVFSVVNLPGAINHTSQSLLWLESSVITLKPHTACSKHHTQADWIGGHDRLPGRAAFLFVKVSIGKGTFQSQVVVNSSQIKPFYRLLPFPWPNVSAVPLVAEESHAFPSYSYLLLSHAFSLHLQHPQHVVDEEEEKANELESEGPSTYIVDLKQKITDSIPVRMW